MNSERDYNGTGLVWVSMDYLYINRVYIRRVGIRYLYINRVYDAARFQSHCRCYRTHSVPQSVQICCCKCRYTYT